MIPSVLLKSVYFVNSGQFPKIVSPIHIREFTTDKGCSVTLTVVITTDKGFSKTLTVVDTDKGVTTVKGLTECILPRF